MPEPISTDFPRYLPLQSVYGGVADAFITKIGNPVVTITASDANASEPGADTGQFTVTRSGNPASALVVYLTIGGSATNATDYNTIATSVTIPAGSIGKTIAVVPTDDQVWEGNETVVVSLAGNALYTIGGGTATPFNDYYGIYSSASYIIPAGSSSLSVTVTPYDDTATEGSETVTVTVDPDTTNSIYLVGNPSTATVTISD